MHRRCTLFRERVPEADELGGTRPATLDVVLADQSPLGLRGGTVPVPDWAALAWTDPGDPIPDGDTTWLFATHAAWDRGGPAAVKQVSLVVRLAGLDADAFRDRYRRHAAVAEAHHGMSRYVQNAVLDGPDGLDAVSELVFDSDVAWTDDFYRHPDSPAAVRADVEGFLDLRATTSALVAETVVRP